MVVPSISPPYDKIFVNYVSEQISQYFDQLSGEKENFEQLMEEAKEMKRKERMVKERPQCSRNRRDKISFIQNEWEISRTRIFETKVSWLAFQKNACCSCKTTLDVVYIRWETCRKILRAHCDSKFHSEFLFNDRKAVTPKSLLPLKAMEFIQLVSF